MTHTIMLTIMYLTRVVSLTNCCINFRFDKERYTPYTELHGQWYCPPDTQISEVVSVIFYVDGVIRHYGYPTDIGFEQKDGRLVLNIASKGYTAALTANQCADGLMTDVNLTSLAAVMPAVPVVTYQQNTPSVNYVNYYNGTNEWEAIVCYAIRASGTYPYIAGYNTVRISPPDIRGGFSITTPQLISRSSGTDYTKMISQIAERDVDGTPNAFVLENGSAPQRMIVRQKMINFDREWIMDSISGLNHKLRYSMRAMNFDCFSYPDYSTFDLLDLFSVTDIGFVGEVDRLRITASAEKGFVTTVWCYHDGYCV